MCREICELRDLCAAHAPRAGAGGWPVHAATGAARSFSVAATIEQLGTMGSKKSSKKGGGGGDREPLFSPVSTLDDDDAAMADDGGPATRYRDDPQPSPRRSSSSGDAPDGGPATRYRDDPGPSIFDWGDSSGGADGGAPSEKDGADDDNAAGGSDIYQIDDFDADGGGFSPVSLHDDDSASDGNNNDEETGSASTDSDGGVIRIKANNLLKRRVFDDTTYDDEDDRIFVGGGWGRHGSQFSLCPRGICLGIFCCDCCCRAQPTYSRGPPKKGYSLCKVACFGVAFLLFVFGSGYVGFEAGLPAEDNTADPETVNHTRGEEWLEWLEHEREEKVHMPHWNFTMHKPHFRPKDKSNAADPAFKKTYFHPMTQPELLKLSEDVFQSCSERSLKTVPGRNACLSLCHGHYCCFEKDVAFGSCVPEANSYCFAYAACENAIPDFNMNNANTVVVSNKAPSGGSDGGGKNWNNGVLNQLDEQLLKETCSAESIATLEGIRDCTALCQHHLCCFNMLESESCRSQHEGECQAYEPCRELADGPGGAGKAVDAPPSKTTGGGSSSGSGGTTPKSSGSTVDITFKSECMQSNLRKNWDECKSHCERYACCFSSEGSCYEERHLECDEYYVCEEFYLDDEPGGAGGSGTATAPQQQKQGGGSDPAYKDIENAVDSVCDLSGSHKEDLSWVSACHALCADFLCCFSPEGSASNCRGSKGDICDAYMGCAVLHTSSDDSNSGSSGVNGSSGGGLGSAPLPAPSNMDKKAGAQDQSDIDAVAEACVPKARRDPWLADKCRRACDARKCCFTMGVGNCEAMNAEWCDEFSACEMLYT